ncbi:MAG: hypothetical protein H0W63_11580 [Gemmatimonadaceae bacterium]|nr:hypothetical protein [Gemmatimonadaceae bacterium]
MVIVTAPALDLGDAVHRRDRALRQAHAARRGQQFGTLIHLEDDQRGALAIAEVAIVRAVSSTPTGRFLVLRASGPGLLGACRSATPITAVGLPAVATSTDPEQMLAVDASLDEK